MEILEFCAVIITIIYAINCYVTLQEKRAYFKFYTKMCNKAVKMYEEFIETVKSNM